jgi:hypothetical protein
MFEWSFCPGSLQSISRSWGLEALNLKELSCDAACSVTEVEGQPQVEVRQMGDSLTSLQEEPSSWGLFSLG